MLNILSWYETMFLILLFLVNGSVMGEGCVSSGLCPEYVNYFVQVLPSGQISKLTLTLDEYREYAVRYSLEINVEYSKALAERLLATFGNLNSLRTINVTFNDVVSAMKQNFSRDSKDKRVIWCEIEDTGSYLDTFNPYATDDVNSPVIDRFFSEIKKSCKILVNEKINKNLSIQEQIINIRNPNFNSVWTVSFQFANYNTLLQPILVTEHKVVFSVAEKGVYNVCIESSTDPRRKRLKIMEVCLYIGIILISIFGGIILVTLIIKQKKKIEKINIEHQEKKKFKKFIEESPDIFNKN